MSDAKPAGKKAVIKKIEHSNVTYVAGKEKTLEKYPQLEKVVDKMAKDGWREVLVKEDGGIDCK